MNRNDKSNRMAGSPQRSGAGRAALAPLGKLEDVLASDASPEVKAACIELAIMAEGRMVKG